MSEIEVPEGWELKNFPEVIFFQEGPGLRTHQFTKSGMKVVNVTNLENDYLNLSKTNRHISYEEYNQKYKHFAIEDNEILMASSGATYGKTAWVRKQDLPLMMNTSVIRLHPKSSSILLKYLWYFLKSTYFFNQIKSMITGSAQPNFGPTHLAKSKILFPTSIVLQKKIVQKLDRILDELEVKKKEILVVKPFGSSKKLFISNMSHLINLGFSGKLTRNWRERNKNISSHKLIEISFPDKYDQILKNSKKLSFQFESEGIKIPREWLWVTIDDLFNVVMGQSPSGTSYNTLKEGVPLLNGPTEFTETHPIPLKFTSMPTKMCKTNDLLICVRGNTTGKMNWADQPYCIGRGLAAINPKNRNFEINLLYYFLNQKTSEILLRTTGSTFPNLSQNKLKSFPYPLAPVVEQLEILKEIRHKISEYNPISKLLSDVEEKRKNYSKYLDTIQITILNSAFSGKLVN